MDIQHIYAQQDNPRMSYYFNKGQSGWDCMIMTEFYLYLYFVSGIQAG